MTGKTTIKIEKKQAVRIDKDGQVIERKEVDKAAKYDKK